MRAFVESFKHFYSSQRIQEKFPQCGNILGSGSGAIISPDGLVLTANHILQKGEKPHVVVGSDVLPAKVIKRIEDLDVMLLKIISNRDDFPYSDLIDCQNFRLGMPVFSVGFPNPHVEGCFPKYVESYVSATRGFLGDNSMVQIAADVGSGCSGSGLFNTWGKVVGVVSSMLGMNKPSEDLADNICYATKSGSFFSEFKKHLPESEIELIDPTSAIKNATKSSVLILACQTLPTARK